MSYESFVEQLQTEFPELRLRDPELPHVSMGELVLLLEGERVDAERFKAMANRVLCFIERAGSSTDDRVVNLVAVSFLENLHQLGADCRLIGDRLGPGARRALRQVSGQLCP